MDDMHAAFERVRRQSQIRHQPHEAFLLMILVMTMQQ
jgi:hypothetical protein